MKTIIISNTTIKNVEIIPNVNRPEEYDLWISTDNEVIWPEIKCIDSSYSGSLYYGENNGLVDYGFIKADDETKYLWSSRSSVVNLHLPECKHCKEVVINNIAGALTINKIKEILDEYCPEQYSVERDKSTIETRYKITKITY
jgi:hypothetical protein